MSSNPLYPFFSEQFHSRQVHLCTDTTIDIGGYATTLLAPLICYQPKSPVKANSLRFAFIGDSKDKGMFGEIVGIKAVITPKGIHFPGERGKAYCLKLFKSDPFTQNSGSNRELELRFASMSGKLHVKRTGTCPYGRLGMIMRDFGPENMKHFITSECYVMVNQTITPVERWDDNFDFIYLCNDRLFFFSPKTPRLVEFKPQNLVEQQAYDQLKQTIEDLPEKNKRFFAKSTAREQIDILNGLTKGASQAFSIETRLNITINLFKALSDQVVRYNISHNDIKPENIMINRKTGEVTIVDFGLSSPLQSIMSRMTGSPLYAAPEKLNMNNGIITAESDRYSMGKTAAFLWGVDEDALGTSYEELYRVNNNELVLNTLFSRLDKLPSFAIQQRIRGTLASILYRNPDQRAPLEKIIEKFETILKDYSQELLLEQIGGGRMAPC